MSYLDILKGKSPTPSSRGVVIPAPLPLDSKPVVERFRAIKSRMQNTAKDSVKQEMSRIVALPIVTRPEQKEIEAVSQYYLPDGKMTMYPEQVNAMIQYHEYGGLIAPLPVGSGKTLVSVLIANDAYCLFGKRKILLMNPPNLVDQLREIELPLYRRHCSINVPFYWLAGKGAKNAHKRLLLAKSQRAGCYVVSYSILSGRQGSDIIDAIQPDLIIGDEIHSIASANPSARGRRFRDAIHKYSPQIVGLSGTITKKSPRDYHHLAVNALEANCFMPRPEGLAEEWSRYIDSSASSVDEFANNANPQLCPIKPLIDWARENFPKDEFKNNLIGFRKAYSKRLETCPGVVSPKGDRLGVSLRISNIDGKHEPEYVSKIKKEKCEGWTKLQELVSQLTNEWIAPNGDEIDHAMHMWRWRYELEGFGFYNNLFWPEAGKIVERRGVKIVEAESLLERSQEHHELHQEYLKCLRSWITHRAAKGLDTPFLIAGDMFRNGDAHVGATLYKAYSAARDAKFPEIIERDREVVRICDFRVQKIVEWSKYIQKKRPNKGAIIWVRNKGASQWLRDAFIEADLPMIYCPAGDKGKSNIEDRTQGDKFAIASMSAYHKGLNLQYHHDTEFFAQWPREAHVAEQAIGRIHRRGQEADEARVYVSIESMFDKALFAACLNDAAYMHQTMQPQKLMYADYDERPTVLPYAVLLQWGIEGLRKLDDNNQETLSDKFKGE